MAVVRAAVMVVALAGGSGCMTPPLSTSVFSGSTAGSRQTRMLIKQLPAELTAGTTWRGKLRVARVRVWADSEYRAQNVRWQQTFEEQLAHASAVLRPMLGVRLEAEYRVWEHHAPAGTLSDHLAALAAHDPGDDVVWVIGLTSSLSLAAPTFEQLGIAEVGAPHLVVRGYADVEERRAFERAFPDTGDEDRALVHEARRRHKTAAVLLHELAHSLGALHEAGADAVMSPGYSHLAASIGAANRALMLIELDERLKPPGQRDPRAAAEQRLAALEGGGSAWVAEDRDEQVERARAQLGGRPAGGGAAGTSPGAGGGAAGARPGAGGGAAGQAPVPAAAWNAYARAELMLEQGDHRGARAELEPLIAAYPAHPQIRRLACKAELARGGARDPKAIAVCDRAVELSAAAEPAVTIAAARLAAGDAAGAAATLALAEVRIATLPPARAAGEWLALAAQYRAMGAVTRAEAALARVAAGGSAGAVADHPIARWVASARVRYGIPRDGARWKLAPEDEGAALAAVQGVLDLVYASKLAAAERAAAAAEGRWPGLPGLLAARCDLELRRGSLVAARRLCERAIATAGSSWALYLLGILELRDTGPAGTAAGIARLRAAIAADPELAQAWRALGKALERDRAAEPLEQLRRDYQARFGSPLPR